MVRFPREETDFPVLRRVQKGTGAHPSFYSKGNRGGEIFSEEKLPGRQADHTRPPSAVCEKRSYAYIPPHSLMACSNKNVDI